MLFFVGPYTNLSFESDKNHKRKVNLYNLHFADGTSFLHSKLCCLHSTLILCTALRVGTSFYCFEFFYNNENSDANFDKSVMLNDQFLLMFYYNKVVKCYFCSSKKNKETKRVINICITRLISLFFELQLI